MAKKQKQPAGKVRCYDCNHAVLQQWDNNPIIAYCNKKKTRDVAMTIRKCAEFTQNKKQPEVQMLKRYVP